ncbi:uncharacterized protein [Watersipora subatra]|uniref:uncharacterized protein n=1 Tax=Watersipora subatra TaxID=2589382 RepID=UPI00355B6DED
METKLVTEITVTRIETVSKTEVRTMTSSPPSRIIPGLHTTSAPKKTTEKPAVKLPPPQKPAFLPKDREKLSTSKSDQTAKWNQFVSESLTGKGLSAIPGLGSSFVDAFNKFNKSSVTQQYTKVSQLLAQYLVLDGDERAFKSWLRYEVKIPATQLINTCYKAIKEWWAHHNHRV